MYDQKRNSFKGTIKIVRYEIDRCINGDISGKKLYDNLFGAACIDAIDCLLHLLRW